MSNTESLIRALAALGQSVSSEKREQLFGMLATWLISNNSNYQADTKSYFDLQTTDTRKAIEFAKAELMKHEYGVAVSLLLNAAAISNTVESILQEQKEFDEHIEYVTTQPDFIRQLDGAAATAPLWGGTLLDALRSLVTSAESCIDIINPYWSKMIVGQLLAGFDRANVQFRVLTVLRKSKGGSNWDALRSFTESIRSVGSRVSVYSPTEEQIEATDALAPIHAKVIVQDRSRAYVGSANLSKGGLATGLEIGLIHSGPTVSQLVQYCDWIFDNCSEIDLK